MYIKSNMFQYIPLNLQNKTRATTNHHKIFKGLTICIHLYELNGLIIL